MNFSILLMGKRCQSLISRWRKTIKKKFLMTCLVIKKPGCLDGLLSYTWWSKPSRKGVWWHGMTIGFLIDFCIYLMAKKLQSPISLWFLITCFSYQKNWVEFSWCLLIWYMGKGHQDIHFLTWNALHIQKNQIYSSVPQQQPYLILCPDSVLITQSFHVHVYISFK